MPVGRLYETARRRLATLASNELSDIARAVIDELKRNALAAKAAQQRQNAQIVKVASELGLNPRPVNMRAD